MGLVYDKDGADGSGKYILLSDIQGIEDGAGDMDYKVAGTEKGINAIQLDNKMGGVPVEVLKEATMKAREVRLHILSRMAEAISKSRAEMSEYAPKIVSIKINKEKIGDVIGPGGKQIRAITEETGVEINIDDEGIISIAAIDDASREKAEEIIRGIVEEAEVGKIYDGEVDRIENYGVFVTVSAGITGLLHVSEIADAYVSDVTKIFSMGDKVRVKAKDIDDAGKVALTMKGVEGNEEVQEKVKKFASSGPAPGGGRPGGDRGRSSGGRSGGGRPSYGGGRDSRSRSGDSRSRSNDRSSSRPFGKSSGSRPSSNRPSSQPSQRPQYKRDNFNSGDSKPKKRDMTDSEVADVLL